MKDDRKASPSPRWSEYRARCQLRTPHSFTRGEPREEEAGPRPRCVDEHYQKRERERIRAVAVCTGYKIRCLGRLSACSRLCTFKDGARIPSLPRLPFPSDPNEAFS